MVGPQPPTGPGNADEPEGRRWQDRDTEPIPRARPAASQSDEGAEDYSARRFDSASRDSDRYDADRYESDRYAAEPVESRPYTDEGYTPASYTTDPYTGESYEGDSSYDASSYRTDPYDIGPQPTPPAPPPDPYASDPSSRLTDDELSGLYGGDPGPSVYTTSRVAPLDDEASRHVARYLFPTEKFRGEWKRHWIQLVNEFAIAGAATILMGYVTGWLTKNDQPGLRSVVLGIWAVIVVWAAWKVADWWFDRFILTNKRVMVVSGIFTRNVAMMPLLRVTDMKYVQSPLGRILSYGNFELESAGQDQALRNIKNLPNPNELYLRIVEEMYEPEAVEARLGRASEEDSDGT
jgi:membrane protein YdbS with pleckstrin-like domain